MKNLKLDNIDKHLNYSKDLGEVEEYIKQGRNHGIKSMTIIENGVIDSFFDAENYVKENDVNDIRLTYACRFYVVDDNKANSREQEFSEISSILKNLARELDITIILLTQLSRAVEARNNHRPKLSDIRESGAIEQDADIVIFLYRDEYYNQDTTDKNLAEAIVAKNRYGLNETVKFKFLPEYCKCRNLENK